MQFTPIIIFDICFRLAAIGQLILIFAAVLRPPITRLHAKMLLLGVCISSYLLLTAPIPNEYYGFSRNILLVFTDFIPFILWFIFYELFGNGIVSTGQKLTLKIVFVLLLIWHITFFGFTDGEGNLHDITHWVGFFCLIHTIYLAVNGLQDDLLDSRRKIRIAFVGVTCLLFLIIAYSELIDSGLRNDPLFTTSISLGILSFITVIGAYILKSAGLDLFAEQQHNFGGDKSVENIPIKYQHIYRNLTSFMDADGYRQEELSIKNLAVKLSTPEHQLRFLINNCLGFRNFSTFLNGYRINEACHRLRDKDQISISILIIALDLGYGSVGSFNRAFKSIVGASPREFRANETLNE